MKEFWDFLSDKSGQSVQLDNDDDMYRVCQYIYIYVYICCLIIIYIYIHTHITIVYIIYTQHFIKLLLYSSANLFPTYNTCTIFHIL